MTEIGFGTFYLCIIFVKVKRLKIDIKLFKSSWSKWSQKKCLIKLKLNMYIFKKVIKKLRSLKLTLPDF